MAVRSPAAVASRSRLLVATRSTHKLRELRELLGPLSTVLVSLDEAGIPGDVIEDGETFESNAAKKARFFAALSGLPTLADDSGLEVDALDGGPGVRTRRYAGENATDEENNVKLLFELAGLPPERRTARYRCALALALPELSGPRGGIPVRLSHGTCEGRIDFSPRGTNGFGYDPLFVPDGYTESFAELGEAVKNRLSHRAKALAKLKAYLTNKPSD